MTVLDPQHHIERRKQLQGVDNEIKKIIKYKEMKSTTPPLMTENKQAKCTWNKQKGKKGLIKKTPQNWKLKQRRNRTRTKWKIGTF